jgi:hypothetical protein
MNRNTFVYSAYGLLIESEIELPELAPASGKSDVVIRLAPVQPSSEIATDRQQYMFNTLTGRFLMTRGREITVDPLADADIGQIRAVLLGRAMAYLLRQRGWLPLHASGVAIEGRAALFLGPSGAGKSTTAAALHLRGHTVITDDVAAVRKSQDACEVLPAGSRVRLLDDSMRLMAGRGREAVIQADKYSLDLGTHALPQSLTVARLYILDFGEAFSTQIVPQLRAAASLSCYSFVKRGILETDALKRHVRDCAQIAESIPVRAIFCRPSFESVPELVRFVEEDMQSRD